MDVVNAPPCCRNLRMALGLNDDPSVDGDTSRARIDTSCTSVSSIPQVLLCSVPQTVIQLTPNILLGTRQWRSQDSFRPRIKCACAQYMDNRLFIFWMASHLCHAPVQNESIVIKYNLLALETGVMATCTHYTTNTWLKESQRMGI